MTRDRLSLRARQLLSAPPMAGYLFEHFARSADPWHPERSPRGYLGLCVAENRLVWDLLEPRVTARREVPARAFGYDAMTGSADFRQRLARFLGEHVLARPIRPEHLAVLAGAGSVLELLFWALADPDEAVLVPTPSYAGFWADLETRDDLRIVPVDCPAADGFRLTPERLDAALASAGQPVRALLWTNPDNPRGTVASREEVAAVLDWTRSRGLHLVCDEIYALSVHDGTSFTSVASLSGSLGPDVHIVWAFSKDFAASGLRCGVLVSENEDVLRAVDGLAYWACCSGDTQWLLGELVSDDAWVDGYIVGMQDRLACAYRETVEALDAAAIPFVPSSAGFFVLLDLRRFLAEPTAEAEHALWRRIVDEANLNLTPGAACRIAEPGLMRLCFAAVEPGGAVEGVRRLARVLAGR